MFIVFFFIAILLICSLINFLIIVYLNYINNYYDTYEKSCINNNFFKSMDYYNKNNNEINDNIEDEDIAEISTYRYNIINYYFNNDHTLLKLLFNYTFYIVIISIFVIIICCNIDNEIFKYISLSLILFLISFIIIYYYYYEIFNINDNITNYNKYYKQYNALVKYVYQQNNPNGNFINEKIFFKNVEKYEDFNSKKIDINKIQKDSYDNYDFLKYFILDTDKYLKKLNNYITSNLIKKDIFIKNYKPDIPSIFKFNNGIYYIDISNFNNRFKNALIDSYEKNGITKHIYDASNYYINVNDLKEYKDILRNYFNSDTIDVPDVIEYFTIDNDNYKKARPYVEYLYNLYNKYKDIIEEYYFYNTYISLNNMSYNSSKVIDIYKSNLTEKSNIKNSDKYLNDGIADLYNNINYDRLIKQHFYKFRIYYKLYTIAYLYLFTILLHFISNFSDKTLYLYSLVIFILLYIIAYMALNFIYFLYI